MAVLAIAATAATTYQQQQAADFQNDYNSYVFKETSKQANAAALEEYVTLRRNATQGVAEIAREAKRARAGAVLQSAETGVAGGSVGALLRDFQRNELVSRGISAQNLADEERGVEARRMGRIFGAQTLDSMGPLSTGFGVVASGLNVASAGVGAYSSAKGAQQQGVKE